MKKVIAFSSIIILAVIAIITTMACIKTNVKFEFSNPTSIVAYANSSVAVKNGKGEDEFTSSSVTYDKILNEVKNMFNLSMLSRVWHGDTTSPKISQDVLNEYPTCNSSLFSENYAVVFNFEEKQRQIVEYKGDTKLVEFYGLTIELSLSEGYQQIPLYFKTSSSGSYQTNPILVYGDATKLIEYIKTME